MTEILMILILLKCDAIKQLLIDGIDEGWSGRGQVCHHVAADPGADRSPVCPARIVRE